MNNTEKIFQKNHMLPKQKETIVHILDQIAPCRNPKTLAEEEEIISFILHALNTGRPALCEADEIEARTHAYLIASTLYKVSAKDKLPIIIAAATPKHQRQIANIYLPQISRVLYQNGVIDRKLKCIIRKSKKHYLCDKRLSIYMQQANTLLLDLSDILEKLQKSGWGEIDLDHWELPSSIKKQINVSQCRDSCSYFPTCRYQLYLQHCRNIHSYDFQITSHDYILSEREREKAGRRGTLPDYNVLIIDEAHILDKPVERIFRQILPEKDLLQLYELFPQKQDTNRKGRLLQTEFYKAINLLYNSEDETDIKIRLRILENALAQFQSIQVTKNRSREAMIKDISEQFLTQITEIRKDGRCFWIEGSQKGHRTVCMLPNTLDEILYQNIWNNHKKNIAVSGSKTATDKSSEFELINGMQKKHPLYSDGKKFPEIPSHGSHGHTLLYIPKVFSFSEISKDKYLNHIAALTETLTKIAGNKAIILSADKRLLAELLVKEMERCQFPVYMTPFTSTEIPKEFRIGKKGILFVSNATISMTELLDSTLTMLIILNLPSLSSIYFPEHNHPQGKDTKNQEDIQKRIEQLMNLVKDNHKNNPALIVSILDKRILMDSYYQNNTLVPSLQIDVTHSLKQVKNFANKVRNEEVSHGN